MNIKKAVLITAHRYTDNLRILREQLPNTDFYIHVDKKSKLSDFDLIKNDFSFVKRINVKWGHVSQIKATLILLQHVIPYNYDYISLISGDDLPLMKENYIDSFLKAFYGKEFMGVDDKNNYSKRCKFIHIPSHYKRGKEVLLYDKIALKCYSKLKLRFFKNPYFNSLPKLYKGTNWFTITNSCAKYFVEYVDKNPHYLKAFGKSLCGDELFFHTIFFNSDFKNRRYKTVDGKYESLRYIDWEAKAYHPRVLNDQDMNKILHTKTIFGRKFIDKHSELKYNELLIQNS